MSGKDEEKPAAKRDLFEFQDRIVHQFKIISEDLMQKIELVAEGVMNVNENLGRVEGKLTERVDRLGNDLSAMIRVSYLSTSSSALMTLTAV
jgi:hypothetical protein